MGSQILNIRGVTVHFPNEAYDVQRSYMEKVIECLQEGVNGILESPTGTGKTLSLLCSTLAWLEDKKAALQMRVGLGNTSDRRGSGILATLQHAVDDNGGGMSAMFGAPKIIYSSRTHSQLSQVVGELKKTNYKYVKSVVLGSRDQLCLHPDVQRLPDNGSKLRMCKQKVSSKMCGFHLNYDTKMMQTEYQSNTVVDIEDLGRLGRKFTCCPYYAARSLKNKADIIFMPYNYLVDPKSRKAHGVELEGNVVIFDEAHNIENMCEESMSFEIRSSDLATCIKDATHAMELLKGKESEPFAADSGAPDFTIQDVAKVAAMFHSMEENLDRVIQEAMGSAVIKPGDFMFELLSSVGISLQNKDMLLDLLEKTISFLETNTVGHFSARGAGLSKFSSILNIMYAIEGENSSLLSTLASKYRVHVQKDSGKKGPTDIWTVSSAGKKDGWVLNCWCFSPGLSMANLMKQGVYSIILTSGTLSPLNSFATELAIPFPVRLENPHIISDKQVFVSIVSKGSDGTPLNCSYENRSNEKYLHSLGQTLCNFVRIIPDGVLVFFPSYAVLKSCVDYWTSSGIFTNITLQKAVVREGQRDLDFTSLIQSYYENVDSSEKRGCVLLAVCRGRVSEGMDFADQYARAAIVIGLPLPPFYDPRVQLKKKYLDSAPSSKNFSGNDWYLLQATRAVNQAVGRVIRHQHDFGAILFCDRRYMEPRNKNQLSKWVREKAKVHSEFGTVVKDLCKFFKQAGITCGSYVPAVKRSAPGGSSFETASSSKIPRSMESKASVLLAARAAEADEDIMRSYRQSQRQIEESSHAKASGVHSVFDALDKVSTSVATEFNTLRAIKFSALVPPSKPQPSKRQKLLVPMKGLTPAVAPNSSQHSRFSATRNDENHSTVKEGWKNVLVALKKALREEHYKELCKTMKSFIGTKDVTNFATTCASSLADIPGRESLLSLLSQIVPSSHREGFSHFCHSQWRK